MVENMDTVMVTDMVMGIKQNNYDTKKKWYVLYTSPRAEKQVLQRLLDENIESFLPLHLSPRRWSDRIKLVETPLFSSYIFVYTIHHRLFDLVRLPGISRVIYFEGKPAVIREREIKAIRQFLEIANGKAYKIELDDEVRVSVGALKNTVGKVIKIKKKYAVLLLNELGLQAQVRLDELVKG
ncbi:hypothetical protein MASR2M117_19650 [Paludibacter sp.]